MEIMMKKAIHIIIPLFLVIAILLCTAWYLLVYDRDFTRDMLVSCARISEEQGNHSVAAWFYNAAYTQSGNNDAVAIELARQYNAAGNYTKAEYTLSNAIADGGGLDLYIELCKTFVEQDKLLDAVNMLNNITNTKIKAQLEEMRPVAPVVNPEPGFYNQYLSVSVSGEGGTLYVTGDGSYPTISAEPYAQPLNLIDGENTIHAITVADNGLVSPIAIYRYTIGGVIKLVEFSDSAFETEIRTLLNVGKDAALYTNDLWKITEFTIPANAQSYADLSYLPYLKTLTVTNGVADELHCLSNLTSLEKLSITGTSVSPEVLTTVGSITTLTELTLDNCGITSISQLESLSGLTKLNLSNNTVRNIDVLSSKNKLQELNLSHNALVDLNALKDLQALTNLDVSFNALTSLSVITELSSLSYLNAANNSITDLGAINNLTALKYLSLEFNVLTNVDILGSCAALTDLDISDNSLSDIKALSSLTALSYLDISHNKVSSLPVFAKDCALVKIDGSHNQISKLDSLEGLEHLNEVIMDYNKNLSSVTKLAECPMLISVSVFGTKVSDVSALTKQSVIVKYDPTQ